MSITETINHLCVTCLKKTFTVLYLIKNTRILTKVLNWVMLCTGIMSWRCFEHNGWRSKDGCRRKCKCFLLLLKPF